MTETCKKTNVVAIPAQLEITVEYDGENIVIEQADEYGGERHENTIYVNKSNLATLITTLRRIDGQVP